MDPYLNFASGFTDNEAIAVSIAWGLRLIVAVAVLIAGYVIARFVAGLIAVGVNRVPVLKKVNESTVAGKETIGHSVGQAVFYLLLLIVLAAALSVVGLTQVIEPVEAMWFQILTYLPKVIAAAAIIAFGMLIAVVVWRLVQSVLAATQIDSMFQKTGVADEGATETVPLSSAISWVVFTLIAIPIVLAGVEALGIESITQPTSMLLGEILLALPRIFVALSILAIAFFIARFAVMLIERVLPQFGFDAYIARLGLIEPKDEAGLTATKAVSAVVTIAILLIGAVEATKIVGFAVLSDFVGIVIEQGGQILFGLAIIIAGIIFSNVAGRVLDAAGSGASDVVARIVKYVVLGLFVIMGLSAMGLDPTDGFFLINIVQYFAIAIAVLVGLGGALAFGLGGRDWAAKKLETWFGDKPDVS